MFKNKIRNWFELYKVGRFFLIMEYFVNIEFDLENFKFNVEEENIIVEIFFNMKSLVFI